MDSNTCDDDARELLGITHQEADWLFDSSRTAGEIYEFARDFVAGRKPTILSRNPGTLEKL